MTPRLESLTERAMEVVFCFVNVKTVELSQFRFKQVQRISCLPRKLRRRREGGRIVLWVHIVILDLPTALRHDFPQNDREITPRFRLSVGTSSN